MTRDEKQVYLGYKPAPVNFSRATPSTSPADTTDTVSVGKVDLG